MADEKKILFSIKLDTGDIIVKQAALAKEIEKTKVTMAALKKESGEGTVEYQKQKAELTNLQKEYSSSNKILQTNAELQKANKGSINELRASLSKITAEYNSLSKSERENSDIGKKLQKSKLDTTTQLKKLEEATGDHRRSVGDYSKALAGTPFWGFITGIVNMGKAFIANPLGLIIMAIVGALAALKKAFTSTEEGQDKIAKGFSVISNVVSSLFKLIQPLANFIFDKVVVAFEALGAAAEAAGHFIADALATFGFDAAAKSVNNFVDSTSKAAEAGKRIADMRDKAEDIERELIVERAKLEARIADAKQKAADVENVSAAERKKAVIEAISLTNQLADKEEQRAKLLLEAKKLENEQTGATEEDKTELAQLEAALFTIQRERSQNILILQKSERKGLKELKDTQKELQAAEKERFDAAVEQSKKEIAQMELVTNAWIKELEKRKAAFDKETKEAQERTKLFTDEEVKRQAFIKPLLEGSTQQKLDALNKQEIDFLANIDFQKLELQKQRDEIFANDQLSLEEKFKQSASILEADKTLSEEQIQIETQTANLRRQIQLEETQAHLDVAQSLASSLMSIAELLANDASDNAAFMKALAVFQIAIDSAKAIVSGIASANSVPYPGNLVAMASTVAIILANILKAKKLLSAEPPKAERGIILGGEPHSRGGTMISADGVPIAEAERGELLTIVNKRSTGMLKSLSGLNQLGGGIPFMERGGIPEFQSGGTAILNDRFALENNIFNMMKNLPRPVVAVQHIIEASENLIDVENRANI